MTIRLPLLIATLFGLALLSMLTGCQEPESPETVEKIVEYRDRPSASVAGEIGVPQDSEAVGIMIFAEGTSHVAITDEQGRFVLSGLSEGEYRLRAVRDDLVSQVLGSITVTEADFKKSQPFQELTRVLMDQKPSPAGAGAGQGTILASDKYGVVRGSVSTEIPGEEGGVLVRVENTPARTATLPDGSYELYRLEPGTYTLTFSKPGYRQTARTVNVAADQVVQVSTVRLSSTGEGTRQPGRTVYGRVEVLPADGSVVEDYSNVRVVLEGTSFQATPGSGGRFEMQDVPPGLYVVSASAPGYILDQKVRVDLENVAAGEANLTLLEDTTDEMNQGTVIGSVILEDPPRSGSAGVAVSLIGTNLVSFTDSQGRYEIKSVEPGTYDLMATFGGYETALVEGIAVEPITPTMIDEIILEKEVEAPRVVLTQPADGARDITITQPTVSMIQFSMRMNPVSVRDAITIAPEVDWRMVSPRGSYGTGQDVFYIEMNAIPGDDAEALNYGTTYEITIGEDAESITGVPMEESYSYRFTTGYPEIIATEPPDGARQAVFLYSEPIWIYFNAPIDRESIDGGDIDFSPDLPGQVNLFWKRDYDTGWSILQLQGRGEYDTEYTVSIRGGARTITGQRVRNTPYRFTFKTRELKSFDNIYGTGDPDYDEEDRERQRMD